MPCLFLSLQVLLPRYTAVPAAGRKALVDLGAVAVAVGKGMGQQGQATGAVAGAAPGAGAGGVDGAPNHGGCLAIGLAVLAEGASGGHEGAAAALGTRRQHQRNVPPYRRECKQWFAMLTSQ